MPLPLDPEKRAAYIEDRKQKLMAARKRDVVCDRCGVSFIAYDHKVVRCVDCKNKCVVCGARVSYGNDYCKKCSPLGKAQRTKLHESMKGENNPAKRPEVGAKISAAISGENRPCRTHQQQWAEHIAKYRPGKTSKLEDSVAQYLPGFTRQYRLRWYALDYADEKNKVAIEIMGCWHHNCPRCFPGSPNSKTQHLNAKNDKAKRTYLRNHSWTVIDLWEHELRADMEGTVKKYVQNQ